MKCLNCQNEINENSVYCSYCGKPTSIVPDYTIYDDDNINVMIEGTETVRAKISEEALKEEQRKIAEQKRLAAEQRREELKKARMLEKKKKEQMRLTISVVAVVCVFLIVFGVFAKTAIDNNNANSFDYQIKMAEKALAKSDYESAISYYKKAIQLESGNVSARLDLADLYFEQDEDEKAVQQLHEAIKIDKSAYDAYKSLLAYYEAQKDVDSILEMLGGVTDSRVKSLFKNYIVENPKIHLEGGTYNESVRITLSAKMGTTIYYTTNGNDPIKKGTIYSDTIVLDKKGTYTLKVVAKNERGVFSEVVSEKYVIEVNAPDDPIVSLTKTGEIIQSGNFTEETYISIFVPTGCEAYYTWDNTDPTKEEGTLYTESMAVPEGHNILSILIIDTENDLESAIFRGIFDYYPEEE